MMSAYFHDWAETGRDGIISDFEIEPDALEGAHIIAASYTYQDYEGYAFVLFEKEGKLFEVNGSHCSCWGLEGQWDPEEVTADALLHRMESGHLCGDDDEEAAIKAAIVSRL